MIDPALRYFIEVAQCGSVRLAADRLQIAPSAISRQIKILEQQLGANLLIRSRAGMEPTEQGRLVMAFAQSTKREVERLRAALDDLSGLRRGHVMLAIVEATISRILPNCIAAFRAKFPGVDVDVKILGTLQVSEAILREEADIGIALDPPLRSELLLRMRWPQPLQAVSVPTHPLIKPRKPLGLAAVLGEQHALPDKSYGIRSLIERSATKVGVSTRPFLQANSLEVLKVIVGATGTLTVLPPEAVFREVGDKRLACVPIDAPLLSRATIDVFTLKAKPLTKAAEVLLGYVRRTIADHRP